MAFFCFGDKVGEVLKPFGVLRLKRKQGAHESIITKNVPSKDWKYEYASTYSTTILKWTHQELRRQFPGIAGFMMLIYAFFYNDARNVNVDGTSNIFISLSIMIFAANSPICLKFVDIVVMPFKI